MVAGTGNSCVREDTEKQQQDHLEGDAARGNQPEPGKRYPAPSSWLSLDRRARPDGLQGGELLVGFRVRGAGEGKGRTFVESIGIGRRTTRHGIGGSRGGRPGLGSCRGSRALAGDGRDDEHVLAVLAPGLLAGQVLLAIEPLATTRAKKGVRHRSPCPNPRSLTGRIDLRAVRKELSSQYLNSIARREKALIRGIALPPAMDTSMASTKSRPMAGPDARATDAGNGTTNYTNNTNGTNKTKRSVNDREESPVSWRDLPILDDHSTLSQEWDEVKEKSGRDSITDDGEARRRGQSVSRA